MFATYACSYVLGVCPVLLLHPPAYPWVDHQDHRSGRATPATCVFAYRSSMSCAYSAGGFMHLSARRWHNRLLPCTPVSGALCICSTPVGQSRRARQTNGRGFARCRLHSKRASAPTEIHRARRSRNRQHSSNVNMGPADTTSTRMAL